MHDSRAARFSLTLGFCSSGAAHCTRRTSSAARFATRYAGPHRGRTAAVLAPLIHLGPARPQRRIEDVEREREISINESLAEIDRVDGSRPATGSARRTIESALRDSEERFRAVWEATSEAMALSDPAGVVLAVNPAYCALYGLIPEQVVGQSFAIIFPEEARTMAEAEYRAIFADPDPPPSYESRVQHADGGERFVEARASFIVRDGERVAMISAIRDITERKRAERVQQDFIAMASHDLLTPVTVLRARAQLLQRRQTYDETSVASILEQSSRMERLIIDLRELVRLEGGRLALRRELVDLGQIVHEALSRARTQGTQHPLRIEAPPSPIVGFWDNDRLGQVLDNLIGNAIKYSPEGGDIAIQVEATDAEALVRIEDHGIGISSDVLPRLFERFYQGQEPGASTGLGLGLYIARMLVETHGGRIRAESEPGHGSTFTVSLPR
jgi:PAS domain S-box-containing protein